MKLSPDPALLADAADGDIEAFNKLARESYLPVYRFCLALLKNQNDAEDAAQEIFVALYKSISSFRRESGFSTWVYRIAYNKCMDLLRKRKARSEDSLDALLEETARRPILSGLRVDDGLGRLADRLLVEQALESLSDEHRLIINLREVAGLSYEEIAGVTGLEPGTVKSRLFRARDQFADNLRALDVRVPSPVPE